MTICPSCKQPKLYTKYFYVQACDNCRTVLRSEECTTVKVFEGTTLSSQWQPIETAPKDGTLFLAYAAAGQHDLPALYSLCAWHPDAGFCIDELREPTHWQPLPQSPQG